MNNFIKQIIDEKFASKSQQKYFFAKASDPSLTPKERKKWGKMAGEFASKTDFSKLPEKKKKKKKKDVEEIVDINGNIKTSKEPANLGITQGKTSDEVVKAGAGSMGTHGVHGTHTSLRYWAESDMSKALGYEETLGQDKDIEDAEKFMEKDLGLSDDEAKQRLDQMGYDEELPDDKVRLIETKKKFIEDFIESILAKKSEYNDFVKGEKKEVKEITPIIRRQIHSLNDSLKSNGLSMEDVVEYLKNNE